MTITLPEGKLNVVQQSSDPEERKHNPLYLPLRRIMPDEFGSEELTQMVGHMRALMHATGGIGISANQMGKRLQVFIIEANPSNPRYQVLGAVPYELFINPRIVKASKERRNFWHGCLSAVGYPRGNLATYETIEVEAAGLDGKLRTETLSGLAAVIFQHELRHMLGGTYLDKAKLLVDKAELDHKLETHELPFFERADSTLPLLLDEYKIGESLDAYYDRVSRKAP